MVVLVAWLWMQQQPFSAPVEDDVDFDRLHEHEVIFRKLSKRSDLRGWKLVPKIVKTNSNAAYQKMATWATNPVPLNCIKNCLPTAKRTKKKIIWLKSQLRTLSRKSGVATLSKWLQTAPHRWANFSLFSLFPIMTHVEYARSGELLTSKALSVCGAAAQMDLCLLNCLHCVLPIRLYYFMLFMWKIFLRCKIDQRYINATD